MRILLALLVVASTAQAEPYKRKAAVPQTPTKSDKPSAKPTAQPTASMADAILAGEERAQPIRIEQEKTLEKLARDTPDADPDKPAILFRLAELYAEQLRFWRIKANAH